VPEEDNPRVEALAGRPARLNLSLWNGNPTDADRGAGRAVLRISAIEVREPDEKPCDWVKLPETVSLPQEIPGGEFRQVSFTIHTTEAVPAGPGTRGIGTHRIDIVLSTNEVIEPLRRLFFEVLVREVPRFDGVVAIDYGTTNTCVAALHPTGEEELIPIEDGDTTSAERTAPSAIQYLDLLENRAKKYEIGTRPAAQMHMREAAESIVTSAKRHLGSTRRFPVVFRENKRIREEYPAREIVADYLQKVRERAEEWLGKRIVRCVITHPSRFALCQIRDLNAAAIACFGESCRLEHLHEPVAAALGAIVTKELCERPRYSMLVYDFGGGTTDITLLEVENRWQNGCLETVPRLLGADGHPRVGGDDATEILGRMGLEHCHAIFSATRPDPPSFLIPIDPKPFTQPWRKRMAEENRMALQAWAEMSKILLSLHGDKHRVPADREWLQLRVFQGDRELDHRFPHSEIVPPMKDFEAAVEGWLTRAQTVSKAKKLAEQKGVTVDIVLLAGKSSLLAPVQRLIRHHFPNAEIRQPKDMKQCVVQGACMLEKYREAGSAHQICLDETIGISATTSRIGRKGNEFGKWIFAEIVAAGEPVPEGGLRRPVELRGGLNRRCRVTLLENIGLADELPNPDIKELGSYEIENVPPEITDQQLRSARVELLINRDLDLTLRAIMPAGTGPQAEQRVFDFISVKKQDQLAAQA
jgi:molecular chaperone DnaK (HSP70)